MSIDFLLLAFGLCTLLAGGEMTVRGASALAKSLGVSPLVIGLTVVAFGTSAPELAVNIGAALSNTGALAFGNVFGSNMANIGLVVGLIAILNALPIQSILIRRELPMMLLATSAAAILAMDVTLGGAKNTFDRSDGLVLLLFFVVFIYYTVGDLVKSRNPEQVRKEVAKQLAGLDGPLPRNADNDINHPLTDDADDEAEEDYHEIARRPSVPRDLGIAIIGLVALVWGADTTVDASVALASAFGVPEVLIGLTIVSLGTSLPELVTALIALRHNKIDMAVGSVVGSNIFNTLLVTGVTATIAPMPIPPGGYYDLAATAVLSLALTLMATTHQRLIIRYEGVILMLIYVGYISWRTMTVATT